MIEHAVEDLSELWGRGVNAYLLIVKRPSQLILFGSQPHPFPSVPCNQNKLFHSLPSSLPASLHAVCVHSSSSGKFLWFFKTQFNESYDLFLCETFPGFSHQSRLYFSDSSFNLWCRFYHNIYLIKFVLLFAICFSQNMYSWRKEIVNIHLHVITS